MKLPETEHWAIITTEQIYIDGDERSRTNPGHGYPAHTVENISYEAFTNYAAFKTKVENLNARNKSFQMISAVPLVLKTEITITTQEIKR